MPSRHSRSSVLQALFSTRMLVQIFLGFSSGLPLLLTGSTLQAWMVDAHVDLGSIGLFGLVGLPYALKFVWSPLFDRYLPPFLGRRRGWALIAQLAVAGSIAVLGLMDPSASPWVVAALASTVAFASASQDIVLDAYRRESLAEDELGLGSALFINGYRIAMIVAGALALFLADRLPWSGVYFVMSLFMTLGVATVLLIPEPTLEAPPPPTLREAVVGPFAEFFSRPRAWLILLFVVLYKIGDQLASSMSMPFFLSLGFTKSEVAAVAKIFGMGATIGGGLLGGITMLRLGISRSLWIFGFMQAASILAFAALSHLGHVWAGLAVAVALENFTAGMGTAAYGAYMASLTNRRFTATQFALLSSLMSIPRVLISAPSGYLAAALGWTGYFIFCTAAAVPGLLMLTLVAPWNGNGAVQPCNGAVALANTPPPQPPEAGAGTDVRAGTTETSATSPVASGLGSR